MVTYHIIGYSKANERQVFHSFAESLNEARIIGCTFVSRYYIHGDAQILSESGKPIGGVVLNLNNDLSHISFENQYLYIPNKKRDCYGINESTGRLTKKPVGKKWW